MQQALCAKFITRISCLVITIAIIFLASGLLFPRTSLAYTLEKNYNVEFKQGHSTVRVYVLRAYKVFKGRKELCKYMFNGTGSGFLLNYKGQFLTNNHVVENNDKPNDILTGCAGLVGDRYEKMYERIVIGWLDKKNIIYTADVNVLLASPELDMAVISVNTPDILGSLEPVKLSASYKRGDTVIASGFPAAFDNDRTNRANPLLDFAIRKSSRSSNRKIKNKLEADYLHESLTTGKISGFIKFKLQKTNYYVPMTEHTAHISPGNSGGPLYNTDSEVIGINTLGTRYGKRKLGFASSSKAIMEFLQKTGISYNEPRHTTDEETRRRLQKKFEILDKANNNKKNKGRRYKLSADPKMNLKPDSVTWDDLGLSADDFTQ